MINFSTINILSQKTDAVGLNADFTPIVQSQIGGSMSFNILRSEDLTQNFWFLNDNIFLSGIDVNSVCDRRFLSNDFNQSSPNIIKSEPLSTEEFKKQNRTYFLNLIESVQFEAGENNSATEEMAVLLEQNHDATLALLQEYFVEAMENSILNEVLMVKILRMLGDYSYEELRPYSQAIALMAYSIKSVRVKSATFNLFGHWGNRESLNMLRKYETPNEPWLKMKYESLINSLEERCAMFGK